MEEQVEFSRSVTYYILVNLVWRLLLWHCKFSRLLPVILKPLQLCGKSGMINVDYILHHLHLYNYTATVMNQDVTVRLLWALSHQKDIPRLLKWKIHHGHLKAWPQCHSNRTDMCGPTIRAAFNQKDRIKQRKRKESVIFRKKRLLRTRQLRRPRQFSCTLQRKGTIPSKISDRREITSEAWFDRCTRLKMITIVEA